MEHADGKPARSTRTGSGRHPPEPAPGAAAALLQLIDLERECCAWIQFEVGECSVVTLTADGAGEAVLAGMFKGQ